MKNNRFLFGNAFLKIFVSIIFLSFVSLLTSCSQKDIKKPNFLFILADDQSWGHLGSYGDEAVQTNAIDKLATKGIRFENAYAACPSCSPSRASILTGQDIYRLKEGGILTGFIRDEYPVFPKLLEENGYAIGYTGKGYWPLTKNVKDAIEEPFGKRYAKHFYDSAPIGISKVDYNANFKQFIDDQSEELPFFFFVGFSEPHIPYEINRGVKTGIDTSKIRVPDFLPNIPVSKLNIADYMSEIEWADKEVEKLIKTLELKGLLENTVIIFTSDNGMPLPRSKATLYDHGVRMPLIISWNDHIKGMRVVSDPVSLIDLAPTVLEIAGVTIPDQMTGRSLRKLLESNISTFVDSERNYAVSSFEKHTHCRPDSLGYPRRAIHTKEWSYIINYEPDRYPQGDFDIFVPNWDILGDTDPGRIKQYFIENVNNPEFSRFWELAFGKVPREQLFNKYNDPDMINNLANNPEFSKIKEELRKNLEKYLIETEDPRVKGKSPWDQYYLDN